MEDSPADNEAKTHQIRIWADTRPSLHAIEDMMSARVKKKCELSKEDQNHPVEESRYTGDTSEEESEDEFYDVERSDPIQDSPVDSPSAVMPSTVAEVTSTETQSSPWKEELEVLVRGGVPMALRGEVLHAS